MLDSLHVGTPTCEDSREQRINEHEYGLTCSRLSTIMKRAREVVVAVRVRDAEALVAVAKHGHATRLPAICTITHLRSLHSISSFHFNTPPHSHPPQSA